MNIDIKKIRLAQARACFSVNELADKTKLGRTTISKILNGVTTPSLKSIGLIAKALNIDVAEIIISDEE